MNTTRGVEGGKRIAWHSESIEDVVRRLESPADGLTDEQVRQRLAEYGENVIEKTRQTTPLEMLLRQLRDPLLMVLIGSGLVAIALGKIIDGAVVLAVVVINTIIGFFQEFRASRAIEALATLVPQRADVKRNGLWTSLNSNELVPGDRVRLNAGDKVPADLRLILVKSLAVDEAILTGESLPAQKRSEAVSVDAQVGDQTCLSFKGTLVTYGMAEGVIIRTGGQTELGRISEMLSEATELETPLTRALGKLGKQITIAILALAVVIMGIGMWRDMSSGVALMSAFRDTMMFAIALAVGAIPEGLPAIVTIALAIGVRRMAARNAIVRKLPSVETLGSTTVICSDKTGTLTKNEMTVRRIWTREQSYTIEGVGYDSNGSVKNAEGEAPGENAKAALVGTILCSDARLVEEDGKRKVEGDPTEGALIVAGEKAGLDPAEVSRRYPRIDSVPFDSDRKYMATLHRGGESGDFIVLKGAPEVVIERCIVESAAEREKIFDQVHLLAGEGMRVLGVARRDVEEPVRADEISEEDIDGGGFTLLALFGIIDPPRREAIESIADCHRAGVTVKMITGDHAATAEAIGKELGIYQGNPVIEGNRLAAMSDEEIWEAARRSNVFARVSPESKLKLVRALQQEKGAGSREVVAMTGDGVNDAPALKQANIGVAMGITGTSASQEASDLVLMDDNFATIAAAIEEGRRVYDNLVKSIAFVIPTNLALALILVYAVLFFPFDTSRQELLLPMKPTQLLWINLVAAVALALPLAFEAKEPNIMRRRPRDPDSPVFSSFLILRTILAAGLISAFALILFSYHYDRQLAMGVDQMLALRESQTLAVTTVVFSQIFYLLNCRSLSGSVFRIGLFSNWVFYAGVSIVLILQAAFIYAPFMHSIFASLPLESSDLLLA
ncbi:MAG: HAD-IC family P-type ATPase, partial [Desulfopila sp.]|nr:HAD-IC family P-type ATPase [Desulfopila sp.]